MKPILTIAIPSYDRPRELTETLRKLAANKIPDGIEILIIDNCSPSVLEDELSGGWPDDSPPIRWIRNPANIGLAANLLRVFEHSCGDWIWILGDDDPPLPDAVARIISAIGNAPEQCTLLKFNSTNGGEVSKTTDLGTPSDLAQKCRDPKFYSNLLFISSSVARRDRYIEKLGVGYHYAYSVAPHIAMLLSLVQDGCSVRLIADEIVDQGFQHSGHSWNHYRVSAGFPSLADASGAADFLRLSMPSIGRKYLGRSCFRRMFVVFFTDTDRCPNQWRGYYLRYASILGGLVGLMMIVLAYLFTFLGKNKILRSIALKFRSDYSSDLSLDRS